MNMLSRIAITSFILSAFYINAHATEVVIHEPDSQMETQLNAYGAGVENWEEARLVQFTLADSHLYHRYANIPHGEPMPLEKRNRLDISRIMLDNLIPGKKISLYDVMRDRASIQNYVVMDKQGNILAEDYWNGTDVDTKNHIMSAHKSFTSMALFIAEREGYLNLDDPIGKYAPELQGTKFADIKLQSFADMTAGIIQLPKSREDYHWGSYGAGTSGSWDSAMPSVMGYNGLVVKQGRTIPKPDSYGELESFSDYLKVFAQEVSPSYSEGEVYEYKDINTEMLGVAIVRASGMSLSEFFAKYLWSRGGFNSDMTMYVNQLGESAASGSANMTVRDFAIGSWLMVNNGKNWKGEQVIPQAYVDSVKRGDNKVKSAWNKVSYEHLLMPTAFYKNQWRTATHPQTGRTISTMIGVNGQFSAFDHKTGNVVALTGAYRQPSGQQMVMLYLFDTIFTIFDELDK